MKKTLKIFVTFFQMLLSAIVGTSFFLLTDFDNMIHYVAQMALSGVILYLIWEKKLIKEKSKDENNL